MDVAPKSVMSFCSSLSFRLITKRQDNGLRAVFCLDLCSKYFALKNDSAICTCICAEYLIMNSKKKRPKNRVYSHLSVLFSQFFFVGKSII